MSLGFLLLVTLLANAMLAAMSGMLTRYFDTEAVWIGRFIAAVVTFLGTFGLFYLIYRVLPERKLHRTALLIGAVASTMLFSVGRIGIGLYLGHTDAVTAFGAAGSLAVVLIWVYYSALAFFIGALVARYVRGGKRAAAPDARSRRSAILRRARLAGEPRRTAGTAASCLVLDRDRIQRPPQVPRRDAAPRSPARAVTADRGQRDAASAMEVERDGLLQPEVVDGKDVGSQLVEHQEHFRCPPADALDVAQRLDQRLVVERGPCAGSRRRSTKCSARSRT